MLQELISTWSLKTIALVGISKNSGKTTLLNGILKLYPDISWGVMSTGLDGESRDRIYKTPKPQVQLPKGSLFCADGTTLESLGSRVSILKAELFSGRKLWFLKAEEALQTEITGPSSVSDQIRASRDLHRMGAAKVLIDGSLDRKSIAFEDSVQAIILCIGASFGTKEEIVEEVKRLDLMISIPKCHCSKYHYDSLKAAETVMYGKRGQWQKTQIASLIGHEEEISAILDEHPETLYIPGAYTSMLHTRLFPLFKAAKAQLIFRHPQCLALSYSEILRLRRDCDVSTLIPFKVKLYALNPWAVGKTPINADQFRQHIRSHWPQHTFIDIMELDS
ncbi:MAG TPA: hypothetical protein PLX77_01165 [Candidatus Cloacimonadota bacterium]|nr:hypothetical protein [Candidatus Cloacimonadota bacterium]